MEKLKTQVIEAYRFLVSQWGVTPSVGIILGTGSGEIADSISADVKIPYGDVPHLPVSTAIGHKGQFVCGQLAGANVIAMQGRFHLYEGYDVDLATLPVHLMAALGVRQLFISNAAGGVNPNWQIGDVMLINSHIDFMYRSTAALGQCNESGRPRHRSDQYDSEMIQQAFSHARSADFPLYQGVYASMLGPNYETRAEYRYLKKIGADAVGMSTVPEVAAATGYDMKVMAMSIITNVAKPDVLTETFGEDVVDAGAVAATKLKSIVENAIRQSATSN